MYGVSIPPLETVVFVSVKLGTVELVTLEDATEFAPYADEFVTAKAEDYQE